MLDRSIDFGVLTFQPADRGVQTILLGGDDIVLLTAPTHPLAERRRVTIEEVGKQVVIAHNDPSPTRDRVLRAYERRRTSINIQISLPSLDGIKRAVEMGIGVALLPRRCALTEIARGHLAAVKVPELGAAAPGAPRVQEDRRAQPRGRGVSGSGEDPVAWPLVFLTGGSEIRRDLQRDSPELLSLL